MDTHSQITELIIKHLTQDLTPEESASLDAWLAASEINRKFFLYINDTPGLIAEVKAYEQIDVDEALAKALSRWNRQRTKIVQMKRLLYSAAAAAVLLIVSTIIFYLYQPRMTPGDSVVVQKLQQDAKPKSSHAYLTLDNGETISLDSLNVGLLATQGNTTIKRQQNGVLSYSAGKQATNSRLLFNKVTVPRGSDVVYLQLADGSKVWLNAESSIRYPVAFMEEERKVEITGEAYFEITRSQAKRFIVSKGSMNIVVLGTRFNVNAYDNEDNIKVTLLEGSVKVQLAKAERVIKPGQQAVMSAASINVVNDVDVEQVMAWKEGKFVFNNTNIQVIARQMERWYDLDKTKFENEAVKQWEFNGEISRYNNASKVLQLLEKTGSVKFRVEGKKMVVTPL